MIGALFTWGRGWIFAPEEIQDIRISMADLLLAGPIAILGAWGLLRQKNWGKLLSLLASGMFIFGSVQVYIMIAYGGSPIPFELFIFPFWGLGLSIGFTIGVSKHLTS
ncbi:MAG: hypothetical protein AAFR59_10080 [Bacteroidota bacterium]